MVDTEEKYPESGVQYDYEPLDLTELPLEIDVQRIDKFENEQYAILRKHGLGASDSSILCGVNPYKTIPELIEEKSRDYLTPEEKAVGDKTAVKKGRDLEPVIIAKFSKVMQKRILKPSDMYYFKDLPWLKINYDGVIDKLYNEDGTYQYIPAEIKVVTRYGMKHYDPNKAWYRETVGFQGMPEDHSKENNSIETKAAEYGIPPYYYTQLQQEMFGLNAPYGYLTVLFDDTWELVSFFVYRDEDCMTKVISEGYKVWQKVCQITGDPNRANTIELQEQMKRAEFVEESTKPAVGMRFE